MEYNLLCAYEKNQTDLGNSSNDDHTGREKSKHECSEVQRSMVIGMWGERGRRSV